MVRELRGFHFQEGPEIECVSLPEGPFGIESQADVEAVTLPLRKIVSKRLNVDAFEIACYSDPGLHICPEASEKPVFGIHECVTLMSICPGETALGWLPSMNTLSAVISVTRGKWG